MPRQVWMAVSSAQHWGTQQLSDPSSSLEAQPGASPASRSSVLGAVWGQEGRGTHGDSAAVTRPRCDSAERTQLLPSPGDTCSLPLDRKWAPATSQVPLTSSGIRRSSESRG